MWTRKCFLFSVQVIFVVNSVSGNPFLYNGARALTDLAASASASGASLPYTNIADLRRKHEKAEKLQSEKQLIEDNEGAVQPEEEDKNEASPTFFQKKINKILTKLNFISKLADAFQGETPPENTDETVQPTMSTFNSTTEIEKDSENISGEQEFITVEPRTLQKIIYMKHNDQPFKVSLPFEENHTSAIDAIDDVTIEDNKKMSRFGQVGVFFVELLGSIVALAYGAAAHLNNAITGTTAQPIS